MAMEASRGGEDQLDGTLERLAGILRSSTLSGGGGDSPTSVSSGAGTAPEAIDATLGAGNVSPPATGEQLHNARAELAKEVVYHLAIPPLTADLYREIDEGFETFFQMIKVAPYRPYVMSLLDHMLGRKEIDGLELEQLDFSVALAAQTMGALSHERSNVDDAEMDYVARKLVQDILGDVELGDGERAIPAAALLVFYAAAASGAGAGIGYHIGRLFKYSGMLVKSN